MSFFKKKRINKTKEQIIYEQQEKALEIVRRKFIDEHFMPLMENITTNLQDAQMFGQGLTTAISQAANNISRKMKVADLHLEDMLVKNKPQETDRFKQALNVLGDQTVDDAERILTGLFDEINRMILADYGKKTLKDLNSGSKIDTKGLNYEVIK